MPFCSLGSMEPRFVSRAVRWAELYDSDSELDDEETSNQHQQRYSNSSVDISTVVNTKDTSVGEAEVSAPWYIAPVEPNTAAQSFMCSLQHDQGTCRPCAFAWTIVGCRHGADCHFCHLMHERTSAKRPCKARRIRFHKRVEAVMQWMEEEADWLFNDPHWLALVLARLPRFIEHDPELKKKMEKKLLAHAGKIRSISSHNFSPHQHSWSF